MLDRKRLRNKLKTAFTWMAQYFFLTAEDEFHRMTDMSSWELFPPSFYKTHTDEEIKEATEAALARIRVLLDELGELEEMEKRERGEGEE